MNRYKISKNQFPAARKYLAGEAYKKDSPSWAVKFKENLEFQNNGKLFFNELQVIPEEDVDAYLRKQVFNKKWGYNILKKRVVGITRARLMKFLKAQSVVDAIPKPKQTVGPNVKQEFHAGNKTQFRVGDFVRIQLLYGKGNRF